MSEQRGGLGTGRVRLREWTVRPLPRMQERAAVRKATLGSQPREVYRAMAEPGPTEGSSSPHELRTIFIVLI